MKSNSVRDIDPELIDIDGPKDRLLIDDDSLHALAASMRKHGQQVPILVRPAAEPGRYNVVYGRRRLAAAHLNGQPVKALLRTLDDTASVLAQGQENSQRLNPSFVEKALFVGALRANGYSSTTIQDALGITRQALSVLTIVHQAIPAEVIEAIGPAHDIGRRRWMELADLSREAGVDLRAVLDGVQATLAELGRSEKRFEAVLAAGKALCAEQSGPAPSGQTAVVATDDGVALGRVKANASDVVITLSRKTAPEFSDWIEAEATEIILALHAQWLAKRQAAE